MKENIVPWNKEFTPQQREAEKARFNAAFAVRQQESAQIRWNALVNVLADVEKPTEMWSQNR